MNRYLEKDKDVPQPDYDVMWAGIEKEANRRRTYRLKSPKVASRVKPITIGIAFICFTFAAIPAVAKLALNWELVGGGSVNNAIRNCVGQQYDLSASDSGVTMNLTGVVTDGEKMKMLLSVDAPNEDLTQYTGFATETNTLKEGSGNKEEVSGYLGYDPGSRQLIGIYETPDTLRDDTKEFSLEAQNLVFYRNQHIPVTMGKPKGDPMVSGVEQYPAIRIESVRHDADQTIVRYKVAVSTTLSYEGNPHLTVVSAGQPLDAIPTVLANEGSDIYIEQVFNINQADWEKSELQFSYIEQAKRISGTWTFHFEANGEKASEFIYNTILGTSEEFQEKTGMTLNRLVVTPLEIQVEINEEGALREGIVHYDKPQLVIGDKTIEGITTIKGDHSGNIQHMFLFESPTWYEDWADEVMELRLEDAVVAKRDTMKSENWVALNDPSNEKQDAKVNVEGMAIQFSYYREGPDLIVEATSDDPHFKGISQTTLRIDGREVVPEIRSKGMVTTKTHVDTYKNVPLDSKLELNPGIYRFSDPSRNAATKLLSVQSFKMTNTCKH